MRRFLEFTWPLMRQSMRIALSGVLAISPTVWSAPGAHGPNGEHLDEKTTRAAGVSLPLVETHTELFELVAVHDSQQLTIMIDRYETNEPVVTGSLEVESDALKATASFQPESGAFVVTDPALLAELEKPGEHALVFTLMTGDDADLLDGTLVVEEGMVHDDHGHGHSHTAEYLAWGTAALMLLAGAAFFVRQRRVAQASSGRAL